jgi:hypothetical protein
MTIIFIENVFGSGQVITVVEAFKNQTREHRLQPGENGRFLMSRFKSIVVDECLIVAASQMDAGEYLRKCA